jgi:toxin ParE1/3/4
MSRYRLGLGVREDLKAIAEYIAQDNRRAAGRLQQLFLNRFRLLADNPLMGEARPDLAAAIRMTAVGNYVILFRPAPGGVEIVQVVHAARDLNAVFRTSQKPE